jgi:hypothetical protein
MCRPSPIADDSQPQSRNHWATIFVYTGRGTVTGSTVSSYVKHERI